MSEKIQNLERIVANLLGELVQETRFNLRARDVRKAMMAAGQLLQNLADTFGQDVMREILRRDEAREDTREDSPEDRVIDIDTLDLNTAFEQDEELGDKNYKGRELRVRGVVSKIRKDVAGTPYLHLKAGNTFVRCYWSSEHKEDLASFELGNEVELRCDCAGKVDGRVVLTKCTIADRGK
jgi:hypothetical protein